MCSSSADRGIPFSFLFLPAFFFFFFCLPFHPLGISSLDLIIETYQ